MHCRPDCQNSIIPESVWNRFWTKSCLFMQHHDDHVLSLMSRKMKVLTTTMMSFLLSYGSRLKISFRLSDNTIIGSASLVVVSQEPHTLAKTPWSRHRSLKRSPCTCTAKSPVPISRIPGVLVDGFLALVLATINSLLLPAPGGISCSWMGTTSTNQSCDLFPAVIILHTILHLRRYRRDRIKYWEIRFPALKSNNNFTCLRLRFFRRVGGQSVIHTTHSQEPVVCKCFDDVSTMGW